MACQVRADDASRLDIVHLSDGSYRVAFHLDEVSAADLTRAHVQGAWRIDREWEGCPPAFVRVLELDAGRYIRLEQLVTQSRPTFHRGVPVLYPGDSAPMDVTLARMGRRVFIRIAVRPLQPDPKSGGWQVHDRMTAVIRVLDSEPVIRKDELERSSFSLLSEGESCGACPPPVSLGVSEGSGGTPAEFKSHRSVTNDVAWKIRVSDPGLYRITGADLEAAGMPSAYRDATHLRLTSRDQTIPMWRSVQGEMSADDYLLFFGAAVRAASTTQNVYWLSIGAPSPTFDTISVAPTNGWPLVTSAWHRVDYAPKNFYRANYQPLVDSFDHWFALQVDGQTTSNITFATPHPVQAGEAHLAYTLHGLGSTQSVDPDHRSVLRVGGVHADTRDYNGEVRIVGTSSVPATAISPGATTVSVEQVVLSGVHSHSASAYIEWLALCYQRQLVASDLPFYIRAADEPSRLHAQNMPTNNVWVLDVSNPLQPLRLTESDVTGSAGAWSLEFEYASPGACVAIFDVSNPLDPLSIELVRFRNLSDTARQADYLVVTPGLFREPVYQLLKHRYKNELSVQVATIEDVYNEFSYGLVDPVAVRQYFGYAYHHYQKDEPRYALLVGSGTYDPLNNLGASATNHIPVRLGPAPWRRTAHEQWFATIDGDDWLPDIAVGRIPAFTSTEVSNVVSKIVAFETAATNASWRETALLVADASSSDFPFKTFTETNIFVHLENGGFDSDPVFGSIYTAFRDDLSTEQVRNTIQAELNNGIHFINFMGHGGLRQWSSPHFWHNSDALAASNTVYPFVSVFTCQNGLFFDPTDISLAATMLLGAGGASGMLAPSALSVQMFSERLADGFYEALAVERVERAGDAMLEGFLRLWSSSVNPGFAELRFYALFGDPAQHLWGGAQP